MDIFAFVASISSAIIASGLVVNFFRRQRELVSIMIALRNECEYNAIYRGDIKDPFQIDWLNKALNLLEFHEQFPRAVSQGLKILELSKDANMGELGRRKMESGVKMEISCIQSLFKEFIVEIDKALSDLHDRSTLMRYIRWRITPIWLRK